MFDVVIKGGKVVDGTGGPARAADVAITDGVIAEVGQVNGQARRTIDADGALVTPSWVDVHTHYDGQVSWDTAIDPSFSNGVGTVVMGNCGVGFAPVKPGTEGDLIELMEGVEDIPGAALTEGIEWGRWESFEEYMDYLATREYALDVGAQIAHGSVRFYVMGERGKTDEDATPEELVEMADLVAGAVQAGALGFSTSRTIGHRSLWGTPVPGTFAAEDELVAIGRAMGRVGKGVIEAIPAGTVGEMKALGGERFDQFQEHDLLRAMAVASGRPLTFTLAQSPDYDPDTWRRILDLCADANAAGAQMHPQVSSRPIGFLTGLSGYHAFMRRPTYIERIAPLPVAERAARMADPEVRSAIMSENDIRPEAPGSMENVYSLFRRAAPVMYPMGDPVDLCPSKDETLGAEAARLGRDPLDHLYDYLIADDGQRFASLSTVDVPARMDVLKEMLESEHTVTGLSDAGAHVTLICDGTMPTTQLTYWGRDRVEDTLPLEFIVEKQTRRNARLYGLDDRGTLEVGMKADVNVIDHDNLNVKAPVAHDDLPAGGTRLLQPVEGYVAVFNNGVQTRDHDADTGERPGRLVRS
ncbi:MAG: amidohydrolase family protein [Ilumatobacter sp.]